MCLCGCLYVRLSLSLSLAMRLVCVRVFVYVCLSLARSLSLSLSVCSMCLKRPTLNFKELYCSVGKTNLLPTCIYHARMHARMYAFEDLSCLSVCLSAGLL